MQKNEKLREQSQRGAGGGNLRRAIKRSPNEEHASEDDERAAGPGRKYPSPAWMASRWPCGPLRPAPRGRARKAAPDFPARWPTPAGPRHHETRATEGKDRAGGAALGLKATEAAHR